MRRGWLVPSALMLVATVAFPCGGSMAYWVDGPLVPATELVERGLYPVIDMLESETRDEIRFLPGLVRGDSARFAGLIGRNPLLDQWWDTKTRPRVPEPSSLALEQAWARGDVDAAMRAARTLVNDIMALPFDADSGRDAALRLAVETIELAPAVTPQPRAARLAAFNTLARPARQLTFDALPQLLTRDPNSPRRASIAYADLRGAVRTGIPDDTREEIRKQVPSARWDSLQAAHRAWLAAYPQHPYATLVRLQRMRLFYLASQNDSAWSAALSLYATHPVRAAAEMRYMLLTSAFPSASYLNDRRVPIEVRVALIGNLRPPSATWTALMEEASALPRNALRENFEERLLAALASDTVPTLVLPRAFPAWHPTASPLWRYLWAASLLRAGRAGDAVPFTTVPVTVAQDTMLSRDAASLAARIHLATGNYVAAAETPTLDEWTRRYLIRVLTPDTVVARIAQSARRDVARDAKLVLAYREAQAGRWTEAAAQVRSFDAARASRYARVGTLSRDTTTNAGLLRFATALASSGGTLFTEDERYFYRGMMSRDYALNPEYASDDAARWDLPWTKAAERARMFRSLREGSERLLALKAFASYFDRPGVTVAERRAAVRIADRTYRQLMATDPSRSTEGYWADSLPSSAEARAIRRAGRR